MSRKQKKNSLFRQVRRAYRQDELAGTCVMPEREFADAFGMKTVETPYARAPEDYYHFRDNGSRVLAVAHLDTVVKPKKREPHFYNSQAGPVINSGALDDRLGAYTILQLLPRIGITCDWLLTVGEEMCSSTAEYFEPGGKEYDWIIEFDRMGTDVVMYQYEDHASERLIEASGAVMDQGSFSDIAVLEHLGVKAFNWGVGYRGNYHSTDGYAHLNDTFAMVAKYARFHKQNAGRRLVHVPEYEYYRGSGNLITPAASKDKYIECPYCGTLDGVDADWLVCDFCDSCFDCGEVVTKNHPCACYSEAPKPSERRWAGHFSSEDVDDEDGVRAESIR